MPSAPKEIWERFQKESREGLLEELYVDSDDMLLAALHVAGEDDAASSRSTVPLPVHAFSKRVDNLVLQLRHHLNTNQPDLKSPQAAVDYVTEFFFTGHGLGYKVAEKPLELYSQYRIYMNRVLAQRCGSPEALAIVVAALIHRAGHRGVIPPVSLELGIPRPGHQPIVRVSGSKAHSEAPVQWKSARECVLSCLDFLKRCYWSWDWELDAPESFELPARAFLGEFGRAGVGSATVGVMQITGRPYGDLNMALLATERLAQIQGGCWGGAQGSKHVRDMGILLCHLGRFSEAKVALTQYAQWIKRVAPAEPGSEPVFGHGVSISREEEELVDQVNKKLAQLLQDSCE